MPNDDLLAKVQSSFRQLTKAATTLNQVSDTLGALIGELGAELKKLNVGVASWITISSRAYEHSDFWEDERIGYDKVGGTWGIALRKQSGEAEEVHQDDEWLFNDAPREFRIRAVGHLPALFEQIAKDATETTNRVAESVAEVAQLLATVKDSSPQTGGDDSRPVSFRVNKIKSGGRQ